jgi:hypothetical protein
MKSFRDIVSGRFDVTPAVIKWLAITAAVVSISAAVIAGVAFDRVSDLASAAKTQADAIQTERAEGYRLNCYEQNGRNRRAVTVLRRLTDDPEAIQRTVLLIDALAPVRNCADLANRRVRSRLAPAPPRTGGHPQPPGGAP